jgi:serine/threonine-protein kinase RsbW
MLPLIERLTAAMKQAGYGDHDRFGMHLVLEEVIVNAIKHGNRNDPAKSVRVHWEVSPERVLVEVEDEGPGFNPASVPDPTAPENLERPGGRGLLLIRAYTSWVAYNDRGNRVTVCKQRPAAACG